MGIQCLKCNEVLLNLLWLAPPLRYAFEEAPRVFIAWQ